MTDDEEDIERSLSFSHWGGMATGLENAEAEAKNRAGRAYSDGLDLQAKHWREVAIWLGGLACDARKTQKKFQKMFSGGV